MSLHQREREREVFVYENQIVRGRDVFASERERERGVCI